MSIDHGDGGLHDRVIQLTQRLVAAAEQFTSTFVIVQGMHSTDVNALIRVRVGRDRGESTTAGWLGTELGLTSGAVTAVVDRLERSGHLVRARDQHDRRKVILEASPDGRQLVDHYFIPIQQRSKEVMDRFTSSELEIVSRYLAATAAVIAAQSDVLKTLPTRAGPLPAGKRATDTSTRPQPPTKGTAPDSGRHSP